MDLAFKQLTTSEATESTYRTTINYIYIVICIQMNVHMKNLHRKVKEHYVNNCLEVLGHH
jgi:hypothetical protein